MTVQEGSRLLHRNSILCFKMRGKDIEGEILAEISPAARAAEEEEDKNTDKVRGTIFGISINLPDIELSCFNKIESTLLQNMPHRQPSIHDFFQ